MHDEETSRQLKQARTDLQAAVDRAALPVPSSEPLKAAEDNLQRLEKVVSSGNVPAVEYQKSKSEANRLRGAVETERIERDRNLKSLEETAKKLEAEMKNAEVHSPRHVNPARSRSNHSALYRCAGDGKSARQHDGRNDRGDEHHYRRARKCTARADACAARRSSAGGKWGNCAATNRQRRISHTGFFRGTQWSGGWRWCNRFRSGQVSFRPAG